jgi:Ca2+-binding RTX toxin-like protein/alpha-tubulin suppressor-like RCC1 family protein
VTVNAVNDTTTLDNIADVTIDEDAAEQTVNLAGISAGGGESQTLRVTASSSLVGVVPDPTVTYTSANTTGSLKFTPVSDQNGTATITVTVEDGGLDNDLNTAGDNAVFSRTFDVTVNAVNDAPTGSVTISGLPVKGQTLTASNNLDDEDGLGTISYQWKRGNSMAAWGQDSHGGNSAPTDSGYTQVFSNFHAFAALKSDGTIIAWGVSFWGGSGAPTDSGYTQIFATDTAFAGLKSDGSITAWGQYEAGGGYAPTDSGYTQVFSASRCFAALKSDGSITAWGHIDYGGSGAPTDSGYTQIFSTGLAFAALKSDGSITAWGDSDEGGSGAPTDSGYTQIFSNLHVFAALQSDGSITAWGNSGEGGSGAPTDSGYTQIFSTVNALAALKSDGSITAWGHIDYGGSGAPTDSGYTHIFSTGAAFAALKSDGSITAWGNSDRGGSGAPTDSGYTQIFSTSSAFAALKSDGSITAWGKSYEGGSPGIPTDSGYTQIFSNAKAFAALKSDGSITAWGTAYWGGPPGVPTDSGYTQLFSNTRAFVALKPEVIPGATETTYTLAEADSGLVITVTASYTDGEGTAESVTSDALGVTRAPTLDAISDLTIDEDAAEQTVSFTGITAGAEETQPLRVSAASSSTGLIPNPTVTYTSANLTGSIAFTPVSDQSGTTTITVTVEDGGLDNDLNTAGDNATFSRTFDVTVNAVNDLPVLDNIADVTIDEDAAEQTVNLAGIGAGGGESQPLQVTSSSSDTGLIPDPTVTYTSANSTGSIAFTPVSDQSGTATITVTVEDAGLDNDLDTAGDNATFSRTFDVTVNAVDDPPVLSSLPNLTIDEDDRIHNDDGTDFDNFVFDVDSDTSTIEFRIVNIGEIDTDFDVSIDMANDSGSFADRSNNRFHAHPEDDFNGSTVVTIEARDAQGNVSAQQSFTLTVTAVNDVPVTVADSFATNEDEQLVVSASGVLANDIDIEDDPLTAVLVSDVSDGTLSLASDGGFTYTPDADFYGSDSFTYKANDGSDDGNTVTVTIDVLQNSEIHGTLDHDLDGDGSLDAGEPGLAGWTVFLDTSDDGILDTGESSTTTLADVRGNYSFTDLVPGDYTVAWITPAGWQATTPSQSLTLAAGDVREDVDLLDQFIVSATPTITSVSFADDGIADTFRIAPNGANVEVTVNGNVVVRKPASELTSITVNGSGDDDTLIVDLGGLDASLGFAADLIFNGNGNGDGSDNDTLQLLNGSASNIAYSFANATDGTITIDDSSIEFSGLEPILDNLTTDHREFTFATTDDVVTLSDDGTSDNGLLTLSSVSSSETVTFTNPGTSLGIHLGSGADQLTVVSLDDGFAGTLTLNGEGGDDTIDASAVSVAIKQNGSGGNDILRGGSGNDTLNGGSGSDSLEGGAGNDKLQGQGTSYDTLSGGPGDDTLDGGEGYDRIFETADVDFTATDSSLTGLGTDTLINIQLVQLFGGSSANTIDASAFSGRAFLNGAGANDTLTGGGWYDRIFGGSGRDLITGGDSVVDPATGLFTYDVLRGQGGNNDTLIGGDGADKLNGGAGHDSLVGGGGDDVLSGESGDDTLDGGAGTDRLYERANVDMTLTDANLSGGLGSDDLTSIETAYLKGGNSNNRLNASAFSGDVTLIGVGGADTLRGGAGNDMLNGRSGADSITGGDGDDTLKGLRDNDVLNGGAGNDWLDGGTQDDSISGWTGDDVLYGRSGDDILVGGEGHDSLYGATGNDILQGDDGKSETDHARDDDRLDGGTGGDTVRGGGGSDTVLDDSSEVDELFTYWAEWVDAV